MADNRIRLEVVPLTDNRRRFIGASFDNKVDLTTIGSGWWRDGRQSKLDAFVQQENYLATHITGEAVNSITVAVSAYTGKWKVRVWRNDVEIINKDDVDVYNPATWHRPEEPSTPPAEQPPAGESRPPADKEDTVKQVVGWLKQNATALGLLVLGIVVLAVVAMSDVFRRKKK